MRFTIADLKKGEKGIITDSSSENIPLKLLEMGCLPGNEVSLIQEAPFKDPLYLTVNGSHLAIRKEMASKIEIELING
jgi:ferrous iron transport protein A